MPRWAWGLAAVAGAAAVGWGIAATAYTVFSPVSTQVVPGPVVYRTVTVTVSRTATRATVVTRTVPVTRTVTAPGAVVYRTVPVTVPAAPVTVTVTAPPGSP